MEINAVQPPSNQQFTAPQATAERSTQTLLPKDKTVNQAPKQEKVKPEQDAANSDQQRKAMMERAAQMFKDFYPISDVVFTIFKDTSGQFITRFTNMRDGKVTYVPEQDMYSFLNRMGARFANLEINA